MATVSDQHCTDGHWSSIKELDHMILEKYEIAQSKATDSSSLFNGSINNYLKNLQFWNIINIEQRLVFWKQLEIWHVRLAGDVCLVLSGRFHMWT